jgi:hypothetical protein
MVIDIRCHGVQSRHLPPPSPEVEFTAQSQSQSRTPIRAYSGWPQHSDNDSKILPTADAQAVRQNKNLSKLTQRENCFRASDRICFCYSKRSIYGALWGRRSFLHELVKMRSLCVFLGGSAKTAQ